METRGFSVMVNADVFRVAVVLVLGFHFDVPLFGRGYWGVDLFFWISGFLITGGFLREYSANRDSNQKFGWIDIRFYFLRRVRRLFPLSLLVLSAVVSINLIFGDENAMLQTIRRIPRILSFTFNMQLQSDSQDYFQKTFQDYGLLHYWSLSVEEQIYVLSPFLFLFAVSFHGLKIFGFKTKWYQRVLLLNIILSLISFWFMIRQNQVNSVVNYYSSFSRFWEFGLGAIVAVLAHLEAWKRIEFQFRTYLLNTSSIVMVCSLLLLENDGFGPLVLIPLASTSLFVLLAQANGKHHYLVKVLETKPLQFFGDIAFPLYLIHWPAMILLRNSPNQSSLINILFYLTIIISFSYLLHKFIEKPTMAIDISRFRQSQLVALTKNYPKNSGRKKRNSIFAIVSIIIPMAFLSYPIATEKNISNLVSVLTDQRYGKIIENDPPIEETRNPETDTTPSLAPASPTPQLTAPPLEVSSYSPSPTTKPSASNKQFSGSDLEFNSRWLASLVLAAQTTEIKSSYAARQSAILDELRKSWFSGCLDSKSAESACVIGSGEKEVVLLGDSFSFALKDALVKILPSGWQIRILTKGSCLPWYVTQYNENGGIKNECLDHSTWVQKYIIESRPEMIVASGADQWLEKSSYTLWLNGFRKAVTTYSAASESVVVISSAPGSGNLKNCVGSDLSLRKCYGSPAQISKFVELQQRESKSLKYRFVNLVDYLCVNSTCPALIANTPVYADGNHFSLDFSKKFSAVLQSLRLFDST
jgi:peptidoglycan/LPS O-acetylase OafA/YrhL